MLEMKLYSTVASLWHSARRVSNSPCQLVWNRFRIPTFTCWDMVLLWLHMVWIHGQISQWWCGTLSILSKSRIDSFKQTRSICQFHLTTREWIKLKPLGGDLEFTSEMHWCCILDIALASKLHCFIPCNPEQNILLLGPYSESSWWGCWC